MPEGLEAEIWRRDIASLIGREIAEVWVDQRVAPVELISVLPGSTVTAVRRVGKVVVVETDRVSLGLHFGMTGRVIVDGRATIGALEYSSDADRAEWDRLRMWTCDRPVGDGDPALRMNDPRRLGKLTIDPDLSMLGPDALTLSTQQAVTALAGRRSPLKSVLLDQKRIAGLGNLCVDEVLFVAGLDPRRSAETITVDEAEALATACRTRLPEMLEAGGSTHGTIDPDVRRELAPCPLDGVSLRRGKVGARTTVWCDEHQR